MRRPPDVFSKACAFQVTWDSEEEPLERAGRGRLVGLRLVRCRIMVPARML